MVQNYYMQKISLPDLIIILFFHKKYKSPSHFRVMQNVQSELENVIKSTLSTQGPLEGVRLYTAVRDISNSRHKSDFPEVYHAQLQALQEKGDILFQEKSEYFSAGKWHKSGIYSLPITENFIK